MAPDGPDYLTAHRVANGDELWRLGGFHRAGGYNGAVSVVRAGRKYDLPARNRVGERLAASLAVSGGILYLRSYEALYAIAP